MGREKSGNPPPPPSRGRERRHVVSPVAGLSWVGDRYEAWVWVSGRGCMPAARALGGALEAALRGV
jgi:hypothetical protein